MHSGLAQVSFVYTTRGRACTLFGFGHAYTIRGPCVLADAALPLLKIEDIENIGFVVQRFDVFGDDGVLCSSQHMIEAVLLDNEVDFW